MPNPLIPDAEQQRDIDRIARETSGASADFSTLGAGKTLVALATAQARGAGVVLIIAPLGTRLGWKVTAERLGYDLPFHWVRNTKDGHAAMTRLQFSEPGLYFIGPEYATQLAWDVLTDKEGNKLRNEKGALIKKRNKFWDSIRPDMLIIDEVHKGTVNSRSQRHKVYAAMSADHIHALSGTPAGQNWEGIYGVTKVLWPDRVPKTLSAFKTRYCKTVFDAFAWDRMKVVGEKNPGEYLNSLPCVVRRVWEYEGEIDEDTVWVSLSPAQRKAYDELEDRMATMIEGDPFTIDFPQTLRIRLRQATLGMFSVDEDGSIMFRDDCKSTKLDALKHVLADDFNGEPALILTDSKRFAKVTVNRLRDAGHTVEEYSGDFTSTAREDIKARFISGETHYLVMVIKAGSTGVDLLQTATRNVAWLSQDDSRVENEQAIARIVRRGQGDLVRVRYILAEHTFDAGIMSNHIENAIAMNRSLRLDSQRVPA